MENERDSTRTRAGNVHTILAVFANQWNTAGDEHKRVLRQFTGWFKTMRDWVVSNID